jgi:hypothetical protein
MDSDEVESMRVLTANFPAEYGRKFGGVVEITTDESVPMGWHGELDAAGGSFDHVSGTAGISFSTAKGRFSARASGLHSDHYLDPPVFQNYTNQGNSGGVLAQSISPTLFLTASRSSGRLGFQFRDRAIQFFNQWIVASLAKHAHQFAVVPQRACFLALKTLEHPVALYSRVMQRFSHVGEFVGRGNQADIR